MITKFTEDVLQSGERVMVKIGADWCNPCKQLEPILEQMYQEGYKVFSVDADEDQDTVVKYNIRSVPTILIFENGVVKDTLIGVKSKEQLTKLMKE